MNAALILSGGTGSRFNSDIPKQYCKINDRTVISYVIEAFFHHPDIEAVHIVAEPEYRDLIEADIEKYGKPGLFKGFLKPGVNRQLSVLNGLRGMLSYMEDDDVVLIHDAARPAVSRELISGVISGMEDHEGIVPVIPVKDTVYELDCERKISGLLCRDKLGAGQTPEGFVMGKYFKANTDLLPEKILGIRGSAEPAFYAGMDIGVVPGDENNIKLTTREDFSRISNIINDVGTHRL
ncbi:MAG: 2-C-methyl-D-erythritol 4-phosphate cytidylyltransferase [Lachnospiraceae bacterium]|nr:2-C-methyl-D-erythritol 4-phosphate cytidylyltransferase [Lachnospiraceae bacterium]